MKTSRRKFLKTTAIASAAIALPGGARASLASPSVLSEGESAQTAPAAASAGTAAAEFTRGLGIYPGLPSEDFGPELVPDTTQAYRNLALLRPAFASSSYDYNLTAQLVTDGLKDTRLPDWIVSVVNGQILPKAEREVFTDHFPANVLELPGSRPSVELHLGGGEAPPEVDRLALFVVVPAGAPVGSLSFTVSASEDGHLWRELGKSVGSQPLPPENFPPDLVRGSHLLMPSIPFSKPTRSRFYRVELATGDSTTGESSERSGLWRLGQLEFYRGDTRVNLGGPYSFTSAWKSAGLDEEWVYVDLGVRCIFDRVTLHWIARAATGMLQVSDDAHVWHDVQPLPAGSGREDDLHLATPASGRYVRVLMTQPASDHGYILSELEVFGRGGFVPRAKPRSASNPQGRMDLAGGNWRLQRAPAESGAALSTVGFQDAQWPVATVPGTALVSFVNIGAVPDPNFGQNQLQISDSFFYADFWYRTEFVAPAAKKGRLTTLRFDGVNWKAEVFLNGVLLGHVDGGFQRGAFDVTGKLLPGKPNALAVRVLKNATPGSCKQKTLQTTGKNGGALGADNPTYHSSIGWDWIPTIRGRNTGLWGDVYLTEAGAVQLEDPLVTSKLPLPATDHAEITLQVNVVNHSDKAVRGTLRGHFGDVSFEQPVTLAGSARQTVTLSPSTHAQLRIDKPALWWPVGYGDPVLHDVELRFEVRDDIHDRTSFKAGIRQMTASEEGGALRLFINGRRFIARGGNWGFSESMLRYRAREFDAAVRYHREMNFTMIRNWVGQIGDEAFFEACDRHGVVVWQDFWLANPWDGPIPEDNALFLANARDFLLRIRRHASIGLYCGRNEWYPPAALDSGLRKLLAELHPGIHYIGSSADGSVSGHGPYRALPAATYFRLADTKLHSEIGAPAIPPIESVRAMMPESALWPQGLDWGLHDFTLAGAQGGTEFRSLVDESYGGATNAEDWVALAQFINYDAYRAMFEAQSQHRMGVLLWMSHPCWPSFVWQTYDFYFEPTSAYFACKKGSEPLHIQWNSLTEAIEVVNYNAGEVRDLIADVEVLNSDGRSIFKKSIPVPLAKEDSLIEALRMEYPAELTPVHFLRLTLRAGDIVRSSNFYMRARESGDYRAIRTLPKVRVDAKTSTRRDGSRWLLTTELENTAAAPALQVRLQAVRGRSGDRILPVILDDNYIALMPGERRVIQMEFNDADRRGEEPKVIVGGFNVQATERA